MEKIIFGIFGLLVFLSTAIDIYIAFLLDKRGYEVSFLFIGTLLTGMRKLSKVDKSYLPLYYLLIITTALPFIVLLGLALYGYLYYL